MRFETAVLKSALSRLATRDRHDIERSLAEWRAALVGAEDSQRYAQRRLAALGLLAALKEVVP